MDVKNEILQIEISRNQATENNLHCHIDAGDRKKNFKQNKSCLHIWINKKSKISNILWDVYVNEKDIYMYEWKERSNLILSFEYCSFHFQVLPFYKTSGSG